MLVKIKHCKIRIRVTRSPYLLVACDVEVCCERHNFGRVLFLPVPPKLFARVTRMSFYVGYHLGKASVGMTV